MQENPNTHDPEYNTEAIHSDHDAPWFDDEEPADETYHPHEELLIHEYAPQEREVKTGNVPAYTPLVNTGGDYPPEPYTPEPEPGAMHIVTYGTVEDVSFADNPEKREQGLVSLSVRDEMDDLIHTDFHTLNPLSLLSPTNVQIGKRVRVDIQDYKNVIEWFVYNYPMLLKELDILKIHKSDGAWFEEDGKNWNGSTGDKDKDPTAGNPSKADATTDDWEHHSTQPSQLDKSYLEVGQRDGNKKILLRDFLQLLQDYFHIDDLWKIIRDQEKRIVDLEKDLRKEDVTRNTIIRKTIERESYRHLSQDFQAKYWQDSKVNEVPLKFVSTFYGNVEDNEFSMNVSYRDAYEIRTMNALDPFQGFWCQELEGKTANPMFVAGTIPEEFRPKVRDQWVQDYGLVFIGLGGHNSMIQQYSAVDFCFRTDGSVWVSHSDLASAVQHYDMGLGIMGPNGYDPIKHWLEPPKPDGTHYDYRGHSFEVYLFTFGGIIRMGEDW